MPSEEHTDKKVQLSTCLDAGFNWYANCVSWRFEKADINLFAFGLSFDSLATVKVCLLAHI